MRRVDWSVRLWLSAALLSFLASVGSWFLVDRQVGLYIGLWVPSILSLAGLLRPLADRERSQ
jgi:hypothetical protein